MIVIRSISRRISWSKQTRVNGVMIIMSPSL